MLSSLLRAISLFIFFFAFLFDFDRTPKKMLARSCIQAAPGVADVDDGARTVFRDFALFSLETPRPLLQSRPLCGTP